MTPAEAYARNNILRLSTAQLLDLWDETEVAAYTPELPVVRGWLMDELQRRDPEAYDAWTEDEDFNASPRSFFKI